MMSLFWYYRPEHTQGRCNPSVHCEVRILLYWFLSAWQVFVKMICQDTRNIAPVNCVQIVRVSAALNIYASCHVSF